MCLLVISILCSLLFLVESKFDIVLLLRFSKNVE
jgi:hypothetical protein